jgi:probable addiction module antidote protein
LEVQSVLSKKISNSHRNIGWITGGVMVRKKLSYREDRRERLQDPEYAAAYIQAAIEDDGSPEVLLMALRHVAEARGFSELARRSHLSRENLYTSLSPRGNPTLSSLHAILDSFGLSLAVSAKSEAHAH